MCDLCEKVIIGDLEWTGKFLQTRKPVHSQTSYNKTIDANI